MKSHSNFFLSSLVLTVFSFLFLFSLLVPLARAGDTWFITDNGCVQGTPDSKTQRWPTKDECQAALDAQKRSAQGGGFAPPCDPTCTIGGIIDLDPGNGGQTAIESILKAAIALASLISFIIAGFGAVQIVFSQGASGKISAGKDKIVSAIAGLLFIVFSITILQIIGVSILKLPGFS